MARVLVVVTRLDLGGVPEHIVTLMRNLAKRYDVTIVCREAYDVHRKRLEAAGVRIVTVELARTLSLAADLRAIVRLIAFMREENFDIVHTHMSKAALLGGLAAKIVGVRVVLNTAHNFGWLALPNPVAKRVFWFYDKLLFAITLSRLVTISRNQENEIVAAKLIPRRRVQTVLNGVDAVELRRLASTGVSRADLGVRDDEVLFVTVARLVWFKTVDVLIEAVALLGPRAANARFIIAGDGDKMPMLSKLIEERGLVGRVQLLGPRFDIPRLLAISDIFALSSASEGMPISIMEAMALSLPVVSTAVDGTPEVVADGETGLLVPPNAPAAFADALGKLLSDSALRKAMGEKGRLRVERLFTDVAMAAATDEMYRELLAGGRHGDRARVS